MRRTCSQCQEQRFICDSEENWPGRPKKYKCVECKSEQANIGIAFSLYDDKSAIRWIYVGVRCQKCGCLGSVADWKVGYEPSLSLLNQTQRRSSRSRYHRVALALRKRLLNVCSGSVPAGRGRSRVFRYGNLLCCVERPRSARTGHCSEVGTTAALSRRFRE